MKDHENAQPQLPYRNLDALVRGVSGKFFEHTYDNVTWSFVIQNTLANITYESRHIRIHNVLNAVDVPEDVFVMILLHEMLHLEVRPVQTREGKWNDHPPEFWEAERKRAPNNEASWQWLYTYLPLRRRPRLQCTDVVPSVRRLSPQQRAWAREKYGIELPKVIRSDDPLSRTIDTRTWIIAVEASMQRMRG